MLENICDKSKCTGCMACVNICPKEAVVLKINERGFWYPEITHRCIECGKCINVCPQNDFKLKKNQYEVFAVWNKDSEIRIKSTSGGMFTVIAQYVLENKGVVFGAVFNHKMEVVHDYAEDMKDLENMRGSKYVQSKTGNTFKEAEKFLKEGRIVYFTGTPCQIHGLKKFLNKEYENLITSDIICHGVPSPEVFSKYIKYMENKYSSKAVHVFFRHKKPGWTIFSMKIIFENGREYIADTNTDPYIVGFLSDLYTRECCFNCRYTSDNRIGDITIADFWGYISEKRSLRNTEEGISLVIVNNSKGKEIFEKIKNNIVYVSKNINEAKSGNRCLTKPYKKNRMSERFWQEFCSHKDFEGLAEEFIYTKRTSAKRKLSLYINDHAYMLPKVLRISMYKFKEKMKQRKNNI